MEELGEKEKNIMENLKSQYEANLTTEQKRALITYNSSLFIFFNKITSIKGYENMSVDELFNITKKFFIKNRGYIKNLTLFMNDRRNHDEELRKALSTVLDTDVMEFDRVIGRYTDYITLKQSDRISKDYEFSEKTKILAEQGQVNANNVGKIHDDMSFDRMIDKECPYVNIEKLEDDYKARLKIKLEDLIKKIIVNILKNIETIKNIPQNSVVLPEDVVVYRGIRTNEKMEDNVVSTSEFISTTLSKDTAMRYIKNGQGNNSVLYSIQLAKGTPVCIFPKTVKNDGFFPHVLELTEDVNIHEIMIDKNKTKDFVILSCETIERDGEELSL